MKRDSSMLLYEIGTGKTGCAINIVRFRSVQKGALIKTLILGPIAILQQFKDEFSKFSKITPEHITVLKGTGKKKTETVHKLEGKDHIILTNYEALLNAGLVQALMKWGPEYMVLDECHSVKSPKAKRSKIILKMAQKIKYKTLMTGTAILQGVQDIYMPYLIMDGGETFGNNFFAFRGRYLMDKNAAWSGKHNHFPVWVSNPLMIDELNAKIYTKAIQAKKEDCVDLPEYVVTKRPVQMSPELKKLYTQLERDFMVFLDESKDSDKSGAVVANLAVTKATKMMQLVSGAVIDEEGNTIILKQNPKLDALEDILEQTRGQKVIVWAHFVANHEMIVKLCEKMKLKYVMINGSVSAQEKQDRIHQYQNDDETTVFIGSQAAAGVGVNLQQAGYSIYFSRSHNLAHDLQSEGRCYRAGSINFHQKVTRIDLVMEETIDELVDECLKGKAELATKITTYRGSK